MKNIFYILFILPTFFSCQNEKNVNAYPFFVGDINLDKDFGNKDVKICKLEKSFRYNVAINITYLETGKYDKALANFEKQNRVYDFAENIYFRSKVSKIRNKDYLDLKNLALKSYDEGKTIKDAFTHHFNKVYRVQIAEL